MSSRTPFAGLEQLDPGELLSTDGFRFQAINPTLIDRLLQVGAVSHQHDEHAPSPDPEEEAGVSTSLGGGTIPAGLHLSVGYTWVDGDGGESLLSKIKTVDTATAVADPQLPPTSDLKTDAGTLLAGNYDYAVTVTDGLGGESPLSAAVSVTVLPGPKARVVVGNLAVIVASVTGLETAEWRLWRRINGGAWYLIGQGKGVSVNDNGSLAGDCTVSPPTVSTVLGSNLIDVEVVEEPISARVTHFRLYISEDGSFVSPCFIAEYPIAEIGKSLAFTTLAFVKGEPPLVSTMTGGANKINPDTDIIEWHWKRPVKKVAELPATLNEEGDVRLVLETKQFYFWTGAAWSQLKLEIATHWKPPVKKKSELPTVEAGAEHGDVRLVEEETGGAVLYVYIGEAWKKLTEARSSWRLPKKKASELPTEGNILGDIIYVEEGEGEGLQEWDGGKWHSIGGGGGGSSKALGSLQVKGETPLTEHAAGVEAKLLVATVDWDISAWWDAENHRFTPQKKGIYIVSVAFAGGQAVEKEKWSDIVAFKNGAALANVFSRQQSVSSLVGPEGGCTGLVKMNGSTDYIEIWGACVNGGAVGGGPLAGTAILNVAYLGEE